MGFNNILFFGDFRGLWRSRKQILERRRYPLIEKTESMLSVITQGLFTDRGIGLMGEKGRQSKTKLEYESDSNPIWHLAGEF